MNKTLITAFSCLVFGALSSTSQISSPSAIKPDLVSTTAKADPPMPDCWPHCKPVAPVAIALRADPPMPDCWPHCKPVAPVAIALRADPPMPDCWPHCTPVAPVAIALRADPPMPDCWPHCTPVAPMAEYFADLELSSPGKLTLSFDRNPQI